MVDFQKGEQYVLYIIISSMCSGSHRQINMDYALVQAVWHASSPKQKVVTFYDINCQYSQNLVCWIWSNNFISLPDGLQILPGIRIWHVHGHKLECFPQYVSWPHDPTEPCTPVGAPLQTPRPFVTPPPCYCLHHSSECSTLPFIVTMFPFVFGYYFLPSWYVTPCLCSSYS